MKRCALLTTTGLDKNFLDDDRLEKALIDKSWEVQWINWRDPVDGWDQFDCAVVRTTWDYIDDLELFLNKLDQIEKSNCTLFNPMETIQWNSRKTYLNDLSEAGINIVPTLWLTVTSPRQFIEAVNEMQVEKIVIKPQVGAGAKNTFLVDGPLEKSMKEILSSLIGEKVMIQPFMANISEEGEFSAHFFNGQFSHMILKKPKAGDFRSQEEFGSFIKKIEISSDQLQFCNEVLQALDQSCLFARVDFINDGHGDPCLIELELIEPSLFFRYDEDAAPRMAEALEDLMGSRN